MKRTYFALLFALAFTCLLGACSNSGEEEVFESHLSVSATSLEFESDAASAIITVDTDDKWEVKRSENWITLSKGSGPLANQLTVRVGNNSKYEDRTGTITITGSTVTLQIKVLQHALKTILLSTGNTQIEHTAQTVAIDVESNVAYEVQVEEGVSWIKQIDTKALTKKTYTFSVEANTSNTQRNAKIIFREKNGNLKENFEIFQNGAPRTLKITHNAETFTLPAITGSALTGMIYWGDDKTDEYAAHLQHTYGVYGDYTVTVEMFNASGFKFENLKEVTSIDLSKF